MPRALTRHSFLIGSRIDAAMACCSVGSGNQVVGVFSLAETVNADTDQTTDIVSGLPLVLCVMPHHLVP